MDVFQSNVATVLLALFCQKSSESILYCTDLCNSSIRLHSLALKYDLAATLNIVSKANQVYVQPITGRALIYMTTYF